MNQPQGWENKCLQIWWVTMYNSIITRMMKDWIDMYKCNTMNIMESATLQSGGEGR